MSATARAPLPVRNPRTGAIDLHITPASEPQIAAACLELRAAQPAWAEAPLAQRIEVMRRWADRLRAHRAALVEADSIDTGYGQISQVAPDMVIGAILRTCAQAPGLLEQARRSGKSPGMPGVEFDTNLRPYPLLGVIGPWNAPLMLSTLHAIPALFAGCAVIVKPSEVTPRFVRPLAETIAEVPELARVLKFVLGDAETGQAIVQHADLINFTGSVANGRKVA